MEEIIAPWWRWCRLCAKEDAENVDISSDMITATAIGKYFWVNIKPTDPTQHICQDCFRLIKQLVTFTERVNKVQAMLFTLQNAKNSEPVDPHELRLQYDLLEDDFEHIAKEKSQKQEVFFSEDNILGFAEDEREEENDFVDSLPEQQDDMEFFGDREISEETMTKHSRQDNVPGQEIDELNAAESFEGTIAEEDCKEFIYANNDDGANPFDDEKDISESKKENNTTVNSSSTSEQESCVNPKYKCKTCGKRYKNATSFRKHMSETHKLEPDIPDFKCEKCSKIFPTVRQLTVHNRVHLPLEQKLDVPCQQCDKKFSSEAVLKQHISSVHSNEKPFICDTCGLGLASLASLNDHKRTHSNEFPYECQLCKKRFKHKTRLKTHLDTHNGTEYECNQCSVRLNTKRTLKMHMLVHSEERNYKCHFCSAEFKRGKALKSHLMLHLGLRPYKCNFCQKTFTNGSNLRTHKKKFHPAALAEEEAAGLKTEPIRVPMISELRARRDAKRPAKIGRNHGGLTPRVRALLIAAEEHKKGNAAKKSTIKSKTKKQPESVGLDPNEHDAQLLLESDDEKSSTERFEDCEETVVYEVIE